MPDTKTDKDKVPGSTNRPPTEGRWVAEPRDPDPDREGDGVKRLTEDDRLDTTNPKNLQPGPDEEEIEEKIVEGGVADTKLDIQTKVELQPHKLPGT
jgi:hypothetical protein